MALPFLACSSFLLSHHDLLAPSPCVSSMPGGVPPKRKNDSVFREIKLITPLAGQKSHRWKCDHCCGVFAWCSVGRVRYHLACEGKIVGHCLSVPADVKQREAAVVAVKSREKKKRKLDHKALEEAATGEFSPLCVVGLGGRGGSSR